MALHDADSRLRRVLLDGLATLEIALRFHIGHRLGRHHAFAHRVAQHLDDEFVLWRGTAAARDASVAASRHHDWVRDYAVQERRAQDQFVAHFRGKYGPHLPVWASTEVMSLGTLSRLYEGMHENDRKLIAARFGVLSNTGDGDSGVVANWLNHLRHVRNVSAHHGRLWNRTLDVALTVPTTHDELLHLAEPAPRKVYGSAAVLRFLLSRVDPASVWHDDFRAAVSELLAIPGTHPGTIGAGYGWEREPLWESTYTPDASLIAVADAIDQTEVRNTPGTRALLTSRPKPSEQKSWLRYLTKRNALIALKLGPQTYYPVFQFAAGDVSRVVADVNEHLFTALPEQSAPAPRSVDVLRWWITPTGSDEARRTPIERLPTDPDGVRTTAFRVGGAR